VEELNHKETRLPASHTTQEYKKFLLEVLGTILIALTIFLGVNLMSFPARVESYSMQPTLFEGDMVWVDRIFYKFSGPARGDVVVFYTPNHIDDRPYIKRVIGLPGDVVKIEKGQVMVGNQVLQEKYILFPPDYNGVWVIPAGQLFVLGDNRNHSFDSNDWGFVPMENVIGKAQVVYWPPEGWRVLAPTTVSAAVTEP